MPRCYSMQCGWLGSGRDSGCLPEVRFLNTPNISNFKVVEFDHFRKETRLLTTNCSQLKMSAVDGKDCNSENQR